MSEATAKCVDSSDAERPHRRPISILRQGGVEVKIWRQSTQSGDLYDITLRNQYKNEAGEWKETTSFSPNDLAVLSQLTGQAFQQVVQLKLQRVGASGRSPTL